MKRIGNLWPTLTSFSHLDWAVSQAARGKRYAPNVARFLFQRERETFRLQDELLAGTYAPGGYHTFEIFEPKRRLISAAPFRDRVVHHALCGLLNPIFEPTFVFDSYACRRGKGTHAALDRFREFARCHRYVLQCDVRKYFPSIDHEILKQLIAHKIKDRSVLALVDRIVDASNTQEPAAFWFPTDDLFTSSERRRGIPIGNQTSQFFANVYLNPFDHFVAEQLGGRCYVRYVDDFAIFSDDKRWLAEARERCEDFLAGLRLKLHPGKSVIARTQDGNRFLGFRQFPEHRLVARDNIKRMRRRLQRMRAAFAVGDMSVEQISTRIASWIGHVGHADSFQMRERLLSEFVFERRSR